MTRTQHRSLTVPRRTAPHRSVALLGVLTAALLGACAPTATNEPGRATVTTEVTQVGFYPAQSGLSWKYLPEGAPLDAPQYTLRVAGPTLFGDLNAIAYRFSGRGADQTLYRQVDDRGVHLLGFEKPGLRVRLSPAWQEYPPQGAWREGLTWSGESTVQVFNDGKMVQEGQVRYRYTVLDKRRVRVAGEPQAIEVWVVNRQLSDTLGGLFPTASQELWFAPRIGEVRTPEGLVQVGRGSGGR